MRRPRSAFLLLAALLGVSAGDAAAQSPIKFKTTSLNIGIHIVQAEVAATPAQREQGLMFRQRLGPNEGMVFLFDEPSTVCMWMKNTLLPLSVAFVDDQGKILNIEDMKPQTTDSHCGKGKASYALEMNQGWFQRKGIKPGAEIQGLPR
jgi:hypothetical protein